MVGQTLEENVASLAIIDYEALVNKDVAEIEKLVHAGRTVGMFYLDLRGARTRAIFDDMPVIFKTGNEFFNLPPDSVEKTGSLRTGVERG
jgi:isopenicillin N synthase-like dioxygenase